MINLIVAATENNVIGNANSIPWKLSSDMKRFKELTTDNIVLMGRKTYESIGRPLPNRLNIVLSHQEDLKLPENVLLYNTYIQAFQAGWNTARVLNKDLFIIGGAEVYNLALKERNFIDKIFLTRIHTKLEGDAFFSLELKTIDNTLCLSNNDNSLVYTRHKIESFSKDEKNNYDYSFEIWRRDSLGIDGKF